jgi:hypothetical protein
MDHKNDVFYLNDVSDFLQWKEMILFMVGIHDLHHALYEEAPKVHVEDSDGGKEKYNHK